MRKRLLIVANHPSANTRLLANAVVAGASDPAVASIDVSFKEPLLASAQDVLDCHGIIIGTTENFAAMSGLIKDFFERIYYPCMDHTQGLPCGLYIRAGNDGSGTQLGVERILSGLKWSPVQPCLTLKGDYQSQFEDDCRELGMLMAAGLESGIF